MSKQRILGDLAHNLDSSAIGSFLAKSSAGGDFQSVNYSSITGTPSIVMDSSLTSQLIDSSYIQLRETSSTSGIDSATALNLIDSSYLSNINGTNTGFAEFYYDATAGQTIFDSDLRGRNLSYTEGGVMVFLNGVMLAPSQYTATDGTTVVLDSAASLSDEITVVKFGLGSSGGGGSSALIDGGTRGIYAGGELAGSGGTTNVLQYWAMDTLGNATDFGDLRTVGDQLHQDCYGFSDVTYGYMGSNWVNEIQTITIATAGNATDYGDLTNKTRFGAGGSNGSIGLVAFGNNGSTTDAIDRFTLGSASNGSDHGDLIAIRHYLGGNISNATNTLFVGGKDASYANVNVIEYVAFASAGNGTDFGDLVTVTDSPKGTSNNTRGLVAKGYVSSGYVSDIDYITIASAGNAADFGDLVTALGQAAPCCSPAGRVTFAGGWNGSSRVNTIQYLDISTLGNAQDFGDLTNSVWKGSCFSGT